MEKFYIVTNEKFLKEITDYRKHGEERRIVANNFFEDKGITGKENHTGLGLWEIRQILKKNNNVNLHTDKNEKYFSQQLEIYY